MKDWVKERIEAQARIIDRQQEELKVLRRPEPDKFVWPHDSPNINRALIATGAIGLIVGLVLGVLCSVAHAQPISLNIIDQYFPCLSQRQPFEVSTSWSNSTGLPIHLERLDISAWPGQQGPMEHIRLTLAQAFIATASPISGTPEGGSPDDAEALILTDFSDEQGPLSAYSEQVTTYTSSLGPVVMPGDELELTVECHGSGDELVTTQIQYTE